MSRTVAIVSSGPSLARFTPGEVTADLVVGVNRAATRFPCDWWSALDAQSIERHRFDGDDPVIGFPAVLTMSSSIPELNGKCPQVTKRHEQWLWIETLRDREHPPHLWDQFSCPAALVLAVHLGATDIITFGVDLVGDRDFTGATNGRWDERRWAKERHSWRVVNEWAAARGVRVSAASPGEAVVA